MVLYHSTRLSGNLSQSHTLRGNNGFSYEVGEILGVMLICDSLKVNSIWWNKVQMWYEHFVEGWPWEDDWETPFSTSVWTLSVFHCVLFHSVDGPSYNQLFIVCWDSSLREKTDVTRLLLSFSWCVGQLFSFWDEISDTHKEESFI